MQWASKDGHTHSCNTPLRISIRLYSNWWVDLWHKQTTRHVQSRKKQYHLSCFLVCDFAHLPQIWIFLDEWIYCKDEQMIFYHLPSMGHRSLHLLAPIIFYSYFFWCPYIVLMFLFCYHIYLYSNNGTLTLNVWQHSNSDNIQILTTFKLIWTTRVTRISWFCFKVMTFCIWELYQVSISLTQ